MYVIQAFFILLITYFLILKFGKLIKVNKNDVTKIFIWRTIICLAYIFFLDIESMDAYQYYDIPKSDYSEIQGFYKTGLIQYFTFFLKNNLNLSYVSSSLIYTFFGSLGSIILLSIIKNLTKNSDNNLKKLAELIVYFPTLNLWTACIGKDAITFACINLAIYAFIKIRKRFILLLLSSLLLGLVRPYIGFIVFFALIISFSRKSPPNLI